MFFNEVSIRGSWQAFERLVCRYLTHSGFQAVRLVGQTHDQGADVIAQRGGKRWLIQVKHWKAKIGADVIDRTLESLRYYRADVPVIVALNGFQEAAHRQQQQLMAQRIPLQLWSGKKLVERATLFQDDYPFGNPDSLFERRKYQEDAIQQLVNEFHKADKHRALIVMATGLGKTRVACEFIRRVGQSKALRVLTLAHTNELVYQLEKSFWPYLKASQETLVWNGYERQSYEDLKRVNFVFACLNTVADSVEKGHELPPFDLLFVDECHHVGREGMYSNIIGQLLAGQPSGAFFLELQQPLAT